MAKKDMFRDTNDDLKERNKKQYGDDDARNIGATHHQARNDYQDLGEPFGPLDNRDRSDKNDTNAK